ncbi:hypothetical protein [Niameybacter massiliensis]|uniref:hypothetical protein n=1 Tax=Niameybacter massiliensis TaxID=1658108 RepID=UPI0006B69BFA|nr:hypothetical protein [Niameybacter massiliensis]
MKKFKKVLVLGLTCLTLSSVMIPVLANTPLTINFVENEKLSSEIIIMDGNRLYDKNEIQTRDIVSDVLHRDADGDTNGSFSVSDPKIRIFIDNTDGNSSVEFTLRKAGNSSHGAQTWPKVTVSKGSSKTIELTSGAGSYSYYLCATDGSPLYTGIRVREMQN